MRSRRKFIAFAVGLTIGFGFLFLPSSGGGECNLALNACAQGGNTISGRVYGQQRQPLGEVTVELLDDFSRTVSRTRTTGSGFFSFNRIPAGRFRIRVLPYSHDYQEQEQDVEIVNFTREINGSRTVSGFENVQRDFYLKPRKEAQPAGRSESIFIQEIPERAREFYKKGLESLDSKKDAEAFKDLKSAIEAFPDYYDALERLGTEYIKLQYYEAAEILLTRAVQVNPRGYKSWYGLAYAQYSQNKTNEAIESNQKAISLNQSSVDALLLNGVLSRRAKNYKEAEKSLKKAKELSNGSLAEVHWQLALLYGNNLNRFQEAADELELLLKVSPDHKEAENIKKLIKQFRDKAANKQ